jgi:hypothetical protein
MAERFDPAVITSGEVEREHNFSDFEKVQLGQWFWKKQGDGDPLLMCVMEIGSNYVEVREPEMAHRGYRTSRVHRDSISEKLTYEPNAAEKIADLVTHYQAQLSENMGKIQHLTEQLGISHQSHQSQHDSSGKSLALLSSQVDVTSFKNALILAQKETLPQLFKKNEEIAGELGRWMGAASMPLKAQLGPMKTSVEKIDDRLFSILLYSGMLEKILTLSEGAPAPHEEKLRIMQRQLFCDEEALLDYASGGMTFQGMGEFDKWLAKPKNRNRILPFPRCMVSMRVRRNAKDRSGSGVSDFIKIREAEADKFTYLIIRNGDQLYRVCSEIDFGEMTFPERAVFDPSEPMMMKLFGSRVERMMTKREYDALVEMSDKRQIDFDQWALDNPLEEWVKAHGVEDRNAEWQWRNANPYRGERFSKNDWQPFDDSSLYFDEGMKLIAKDIKDYNRIALVVQGLFDRTTTLAPHPPVQMWRAESFSRSVELVYDSSMVLHYGEAPDIQAYIDRCNAQTTSESVMFGQELVWLEKEAKRENTRIDADWRDREKRKVTHFRHHGDNGPGQVALMAKWKPRSKVATFTWRRESRIKSWEMLEAQVTAPLDRLFNISAYKLGDFEQFFADPRTRAKYLQWAPMLLSAEDYHNGVLKAQEPVIEAKRRPPFRS